MRQAAGVWTKTGGLCVNEREIEVLQQYELTVRKLYRSRGAFYCETSQGLRLLKETEASEERLQWEAWILERCRQMDEKQKAKEALFKKGGPVQQR